MDEERRIIELSEEQLERIAIRVHEKVLQDIFIQVGKGSIRLMLYLLGAAIAAVWAWTSMANHLSK